MWLLAAPIKYKTISFMVDSQSAIRAVNKSFVTSSIIKKAIAALSEVAKTNILKFYWVKSHSGIPGNERADEMAKRGAKDSGWWTPWQCQSILPTPCCRAGLMITGPSIGSLGLTVSRPNSGYCP